MTQKTQRYKIIQQGGSGAWRSLQQYLSQTIPLTLYAGNLPKSWNQQNIKDYFSSYGTIGKVHLIKKYSRFTGAAFIQFSSVTDADEAIIKLKGITIPGGLGPINIKWADTEQQRLGIRQNEDHKLFIKSLPRKATSESLQEVFSLIGDIDEISMEEGKWYAHIRFKIKESALRAIKLLSGQTFLHGSNIPIEVKFKDRKYVPEPVSKAIPDPLSMHQAQQQIFCQIFDQNKHYFYNCQTQKTQYQTPPAGATVYRMDGTQYIQQNQEQQKEFIGEKISGPPGANLFVYYLPNKMKNTDLYNLFKRYGNILSSKVMSKDGVSRGYGFVNFDNVKSAKEAMDELNGLECEGKKLKVELKKGAENNLTEQPTMSLRQMNFNPF